MSLLVKCKKTFVLLAATAAVSIGGLASAQNVGVVSHVNVVSDKSEDVSTLEAWKKTYIKEGMSDQDKAIAIFNTLVKYRHQANPPNEGLTSGETGGGHGDVVRELDDHDEIVRPEGEVHGLDAPAEPGDDLLHGGPPPTRAFPARGDGRIHSLARVPGQPNADPEKPGFPYSVSELPATFRDPFPCRPRGNSRVSQGNSSKR